MEILVNDNPYTLEFEITLDELLAQVGLSERREGIAIAVNREIVVQEDWGKRKLKRNDTVDIIEATQGG